MLIHVDVQDKQLTVIVQERDLNQLSLTVSSWFATEGYRLETGTPLNAVYGKGSALLRFFLGGFVKRYKYSVRIFIDHYGNGAIQVAPAHAGWSGGLLGINQTKKEFERIKQMFPQRFQAPPPQMF